MTSNHSPADIPEGFRPANIGGPFMVQNGPLYAKWSGERVLLGFRVEPRHTNPLGVCHGGMMASFADMLMPCAAIYQMQGERRFLPTISLNIDYLGASPLGAWVQGQADVLRSTRNMLFAQGLVTADGTPVMRVSGIFKMGVLLDDGAGHDPFGLRAPH
ncbi:MAG: PaaI family thioesterase [Rhodoferax sp.]